MNRYRQQAEQAIILKRAFDLVESEEKFERFAIQTIDGHLSDVEALGGIWAYSLWVV